MSTATASTGATGSGRKPVKMHTIKTLAGSIREYTKASLLSPLFVVVEAIIEILIPTVIATLIDKGITNRSMQAIWQYGLILILCAAVSLAAGFLSGRFAAIASSGFGKNLRHDEFERVQQFSFTNIDRFSTGSIITRLTTDVTNVQNSYQMIIRIGMRAPIMLVAAWIFSFRISPQISMVFLACIPVLAVGLIGLIIIVHPIFERVFHTYDELNNVVDENLQGIRVVKSFNREDHEDRKFGHISQLIYKQFVKAEKLLSINSPLFNVCMYASLITIAWVGAQQIVASGNNAANGLTTGDLTALVTYALQIMMSMMMVSMIFVMVIISRASAERITQLLTEESTIKESAQPITQVNDGSIDFDDVTFRYSEHSEKPVLDHIDLHIKSGQTIGIVGGTGSAKSSLVQLIPRLYDVSSGTLKVGGVDVRDYELESLRDEVAMVLQKNVLFSGTIAENLRWGNPYATDEEIRHACELAQADGFIEEFPDKYDTYIEQGGTNVSGGQRQRLCIARALLKKPKILILDDSTSAVDTKTDKLIREAFHHEIPNTTKIIIAQRVASVEESDSIIVMHEGRVLDQGTSEELLERCEEYRSIYLSQTQQHSQQDLGKESNDWHEEEAEATKRDEVQRLFNMELENNTDNANGGDAQ
ncbi:ABC transporter [Bifidobacterium animalis subsp. animalis MCC 1489]|uniref:ABC-type multidrug transport system ATPase and pe rmease component n=1 Tax=Bifidobacterium animalis subsp. animalis IM386 TaxID=1402194 RepID=A0AAV2W4C3_9BIFI|nr:ABC transporter ATP-binding protein [Bifidobacterium animalis]AFI63481.1 ABC-type multidrug transport system ATPase and permease component [Bifidobacterium animalis subsp. animalis ATCC 25527]AYN24108.1 multidrug ABC transporter ATPase/permease [Bifidobacterium animalis subsp. animalis]KFI41661.1 multidrug ABC transporter ATPase/permease [Bifidobacterium animalis subsp. animalis]KOA63556.1 ABC transporter [Bifidobacterium animalis subsp. animalis MCC 1489]CDI68201.1 ABC-type multidrug trans